MLHCLSYSVTTNESKEMFKIGFCCIPTISNTVAPFSYNFPMTLICSKIVVFVCLEKSIPINL